MWQLFRVLEQNAQVGPKKPGHSLQQRLLDLVVAGQLRRIDDGIASNVGAQAGPQGAHALCKSRGRNGGWGPTQHPMARLDLKAKPSRF